MTQSFASLTLPAAQLDNLTELGYTSMTPVQAEALPVILQGRDVRVQAKTGSGKTAAFGIGLLQHSHWCFARPVNWQTRSVKNCAGWHGLLRI